MKSKRNRKWKIPHTVLQRWTLCFSSRKNRKLKVKLWWIGARERKKRTFFVPLILCEGIFLWFVFYLNVKCIEYTLRIYILLHIKKYYFIHLCCLFLKSSKTFSVSLRQLWNKQDWNMNLLSIDVKEIREPTMHK